MQAAPPHPPPLQSAALVHAHAPPTHARPVPHWELDVHVVWPHVPAVAPVHANDPFGQSALVPQASWHWPIAPVFEPPHVAVTPQSAFAMHWFVLPTSALADTWKSL